MPNKPEDLIQSEVTEVLHLEKSLVDLEQELSKNEQFRTFLTKQKKAQAQISETWKNVERQMIEHDVKSIKGEWGSITIAERTNYAAEGGDLSNVPSKFIKKTLDTTKVAAAAKLEGKLPRGITSSVTKYLTKRIK